MTGANPDRRRPGGRMKLHRFMPSGRRIWTVVGKEDEHWLDPDLGYCSCPSFYYGGAPCYHIRGAPEAQADVVDFSDAEFDGFVAGLVLDTFRA